MSDNKILRVVLEGDNSSFISSVGQANSFLKENLGEMSKSFGGLGQAMSGLAGPLAAFGSMAGSIAAIGEMVTHTAELGETLELTSQKTGVSVEELSKLRYAAKMVEIDFDSLAKGLERLSKNMMESILTPTSITGQAFKVLGINVKDATGHLKDTKEVFTEIAEKFSSFKDGPEKTALAMAIFGRAGAELIPILNEGKEGLEKLGLAAKNAGDVMSDEAAKKAAHFDDQIKDLKARGEGLSISIGSSLIPSLSVLADSFGNGTGGSLALSAAIGVLKLALNIVIGAILFLSQGIKTLWDIGSFVFKTLKGLVVALGSGIYDAIHGNLSKAKDDFKNFGTDVVNNWNKTLDSLYDSSNRTEQGFFKLGGQGTPEAPKEENKKQTGNAPKFNPTGHNKAEEAAKKHAQEVKTLNTQLEKEHILLTKGADAAYSFELAQKGLTKAEIAHFSAMHKSNEELKIKQEADKKAAEQAKKVEQEYQKEHEARLKLNNDNNYKLVEQGIKDKYNAYEISGAEELRQLKDLDTKKYEEEKKALIASINSAKTDKAQKEKLLVDLDKLTFKYYDDQKKYKQQLDQELLKGNGWAGAKKAAQDFVDSSKNRFKDFSNMASSVLSSAQSSISNSLKGMIQGTMTFGDAIKSVWSSITDTILSSITNMVAQWLVAQAAQAIFATTTQVTESTKAAASLDTANAETWAAYAAIPFAGPILAMSQIGAMTAEFTAAKAANKGITAYATGGLVDTPTLGLLGEAGKEYLVPDRDMKSLLPSLVNQGAQIYKSMLTSNAYANKSLGSKFAPSKQVVNNSSQGHTFNISGVIGDKKQLGDYIKGLINNNTRLYGSAL